MLGCISVSIVSWKNVGEGDIRHEPISKVVGVPGSTPPSGSHQLSTSLGL